MPTPDPCKDEAKPAWKRLVDCLEEEKRRKAAAPPPRRDGDR